MIRRTQPPLNPPTVARAVQNALVAGLAAAYLGAAAMQLVRNDIRLAIVDMSIAAGLGIVLSIVSRRHGRVLSTYGTRRVISSASTERWCSWCGESISAGSRKVAHKGAHEGKPYSYHHHTECDAASVAWAGGQGAKHLISHPEPGSMVRGQPESRGSS